MNTKRLTDKIAQLERQVEIQAATIERYRRDAEVWRRKSIAAERVIQEQKGGR